MTKNVYILIMLVFAFLLGPTQSFATTTQEAEHSCMDMSSTMSCCSTTDTSSTDQDQTSCKGNCGTSTCVSPISLHITGVVIEEDYTIFISPELRQNHYYSEALISSDFRSIWLPPKIA